MTDAKYAEYAGELRAFGASVMPLVMEGGKNSKTQKAALNWDSVANEFFRALSNSNHKELLRDVNSPEYKARQLGTRFRARMKGKFGNGARLDQHVEAIRDESRQFTSLLGELADRQKLVSIADRMAELLGECQMKSGEPYRYRELARTAVVDTIKIAA
jgi:hypothetical protein